MRRGLLGSSGTSVSRRSDASSRAASSSPTGIAFRVLATKRESLRAQTKAGHAIRYNLLQRVEETHVCCFPRYFLRCLSCDVPLRRVLASFRQSRMSSPSIIQS